MKLRSILIVAIALFASSCVTSGDLRLMQGHVDQISTKIGDVATKLEQGDIEGLRSGLEELGKVTEEAEGAIEGIVNEVQGRELDAGEIAGIAAAIIAALGGSGAGLVKLAAVKVNKERDAARVLREEPVGLEKRKERSDAN